MIVSIKNNKGGVGKSWLTLQLAHLLSMLDKKVLVLTSDSQNNILEFSGVDTTYGRGLEDWVTKGTGDIIRLRENLMYIPLKNNDFSPQFREKLKIFTVNLKKEYDYILIDSVPTLKVDKEFEQVSDKILIPIFMDHITLSGTLNMLNEVDHKKIIGLVPNRFTGNKIEKEIYNQLKEILDGNEIKMFEPIKQKSFISELISKNKTIWESNSVKIADVQKIISEILEEIIDEK
ncbi:MAG: ParA family protein [Cetobacterium sp.]|uniref:ParA family protein n=1 Tax=Cetobacterium sp. TaxID=2071632 RepID=UPI002FC6D530